MPSRRDGVNASGTENVSVLFILRALKNMAKFIPSLGGGEIVGI
jgi:hypothetical protein